MAGWLVGCLFPKVSGTKRVLVLKWTIRLLFLIFVDALQRPAPTTTTRSRGWLEWDVGTFQSQLRSSGSGDSSSVLNIIGCGGFQWNFWGVSPTRNTPTTISSDVLHGNRNSLVCGDDDAERRQNEEEVGGGGGGNGKGSSTRIVSRDQSE